MMGGVGLIVSTMLLSRLIGIGGLPEGFPSHGLPFIIASACILIAVLTLLLFVREKIPEDTKEEKREPLIASIKRVFTSGDSSVGRILISLFLWFMSYEGLKPFLGLYMVEALGVSEGNAALAQGVAGIAGVMMAVPVGYAAHRLGRRRYIRSSLALLTLIMLLIPAAGLLGDRAGIAAGGVLAMFLMLMFLYGAVWIGIVVNSFPMLWQLASFGTMGIYTGLYYTFSQSAAILAPPVTGLIIDLAGYAGIFIFGALCMAGAWCTMAGVQAGEPDTAAGSGADQ